MPLEKALLGMSCVMLTSKKQLAEPPLTKEASPVANEKPSQAGASQQACRQASVEDASMGAPGESTVPTRVPTRSMRGRERKKEGAQ